MQIVFALTMSVLHSQGGTQFRKTKERLLNSGEELDKKALHTVIKCR